MITLMLGSILLIALNLKYLYDVYVIFPEVSRFDLLGISFSLLVLGGFLKGTEGKSDGKDNTE